MNFGLSPEEWELLQSLLIRPLKEKGARVWIFGSRATGKYRPFSDIDVLFETPSPLPSGFLFELKDSLEESRLSYKVDLVDMAHLASSYRADVLRERVAV